MNNFARFSNWSCTATYMTVHVRHTFWSTFFKISRQLWKRTTRSTLSRTTAETWLEYRASSLRTQDWCRLVTQPSSRVASHKKFPIMYRYTPMIGILLLIFSQKSRSSWTFWCRGDITRSTRRQRKCWGRSVTWQSNAQRSSSTRKKGSACGTSSELLGTITNGNYFMLYSAMLNRRALVMWRKINGQWKIQADCWNFDHPEPKAWTFPWQQQSNRNSRKVNITVSKCFGRLPVHYILLK